MIAALVSPPLAGSTLLYDSVTDLPKIGIYKVYCLVKKV